MTFQKKTFPGKEKSRIIYIEADEDHVALQTGGIVMPKLVYVHEGLMCEDFKSDRKRLVNAKYFASTGETHTRLWERVLTIYMKSMIGIS